MMVVLERNGIRLFGLIGIERVLTANDVVG
jgi:hypothetical protein